MKGEDQILELLAEVLRKQDQLHEDVRLLKEETQITNVRPGNVAENHQAHQQILRMLAVSQQQRELEGITDIMDSIARMQRNQNRCLDRLENPNDFV